MGRPAPIQLTRQTLDWSRVYVVGVLNVTPDSFSDGGLYDEQTAAIARGIELAAEGADIIDVGGESTRPQGARAVGAAEEIERVIPVVRALARRGLTVSVDTTKAAVARAALEAGAELVNDISGGLFEPPIIEVTAAAGAVYVLGHARGRTIAEVHAGENQPPSADEVADELLERARALPDALQARTIVDPGLGFGKRTAENVELTRRAAQIGALVGCPVMLGPSRKRFLGELTGAAMKERDPPTIGAALAAVASGAQLVRVHNVKLLKPALVVYEAIRGGGS